MFGLGVVAHDGRRVGRCHVPARRKVRRRALGRDREDELDLADVGGKADAATHGAILALMKFSRERQWSSVVREASSRFEQMHTVIYSPQFVLSKILCQPSRGIRLTWEIEHCKKRQHSAT